MKVLKLFMVMLVFFISCSEDSTDPNGDTNNDNSTKTDSTDLIKGILDLPDSVSDAESSSTASTPPYRAPMIVKAAGTSADQSNANEILSFVRGYVGLCDEMAAGVEEYLGSLKNSDLPDSWAGEDDGTYLILDPYSNSGYTHRIRFYTSSNETNINDMTGKVLFDKTTWEKGEVIFKKGFFSGLEGDIQVTYDGTTAGGTSMMVALAGFPVAETDKWGISNVYIEVTEKEDEMTLAGGSWHPDAGKNTSPQDLQYFKDGLGRAYMFRAVIDTTADRAVVDIATATNGQEVSDVGGFFTDYGVDKELNRSYARQIRKGQVATNIDFNELATTLDPWVSAITNSDIPASNGAMTAEQFKAILEGYQEGVQEYPEIQESEEISQLLFIFSMNNPVYFNENGYHDNGKTSVSGYPEKSQLSAVSLPKTPAELNNLSLSLTD